MKRTPECPEPVQAAKPLIALAIVAVFLPLERVVSDDGPSVALTARGLTFPYRDTAIFALRHERVTFEVRGPASRLRMVAEPAPSHVVTIGPNRWTWRAPQEPVP